MEENKSKAPIKNTKRLQTLKKKAMELSVLCNVDVCLLGTQENPTSGSASTPVWHTWPEDPENLARIVNKYKNYVDGEEQEEEAEIENRSRLNKKAILEFDVDKALEGIDDLEDLKEIFNRANEIATDVDEKLELLRKQNCDQNSPMVVEGVQPLNSLPASDSDSILEVAPPPGPKVFGFYLRPDASAKEKIDNAQENLLITRPNAWDLNFQPPNDIMEYRVPDKN